jgi:hypothetical protein
MYSNSSDVSPLRNPVLAVITGSILTACLCYQGHCAAEAGIEGVARHKEARFAQGEFYKDAAAGTLPAFSFVSPPGCEALYFTRDSTLATCKESLTNKTSFERALSHPNSPTLPLPDPGARERHQNPAVSTRLRSAPFALPLHSWCLQHIRRIFEAFVACRSSDLSSQSHTHRLLALGGQWQASEPFQCWKVPCL